jgi:ribosome-associated protein
MGRGFRFVAVATARALSEKKAERVMLLHVSATSPITDYLLLATATSRPHLEALEAELDKTVKDYNLKPLRRSRPRSETWRVVDYGGIVVHLMTQETRELYALEKIYPDSRQVRWDTEEAANEAPKRKKKHG